MSKSKSKTYTTSELARHFNISVVSASRFIVKHKLKPVKTGQHNAKYYSDAVFQQMEEYYQDKPKTQEKQTYPATKDTIIEQLKGLSGEGHLVIIATHDKRILNTADNIINLK